MSRYRAMNGEESPVVLCDDDEPGVVFAMAGRQQDVELIAAALNLAEAAKTCTGPIRRKRTTMANDPVTLALEEIKFSLGVIQDECENYGGWAGEDAEAKVAMDLGMDLLSLGYVVGLHGREVAEGGAADA